MLSLLVASLAAAVAASSANTTYPAINTTLGYVRGTTSGFREGITVYRGIPYGASTAGEKRWTAPVSPEPWNETFDATTFGPICASPANDQAGIFSNGKTDTSEDCLSLNIWVPQNATDAPVYFWIFGGRFEGGSGDVKTYDGSGLASRGIIVVTINYRLGAFGWLAHPTLSEESGHNSSGNYGLLDQQLALKWVNDNIANFGGNSSQITVGGQSAGSASALDVMYSPLADGMAQGIIAESGARGVYDPLTGSLATSHRTKATAEAQGVSFLSTMNVTSIAELRNVSTAALEAEGNLSDDIFDDSVYRLLDSAFMNPPLWRPVIDGYVLPELYGEILASGNHSDIPIMTGNNKDESGAAVAPTYTNTTAYKEAFELCFGSNLSSTFFSLYPYNGTLDQVNNYTNEFWRDNSRVSTYDWAKLWRAGGAKSDVYVYYWTHTPAENSEDGAYHGSELWYVFNNIPYADYSNVTWYADDYNIEAQMSSYWVNFIKTGNPNGGNLTEFPPASDDYSVMWLGDSFGADKLANSDAQIDFIQSWYSTLPEW